VKTSKLQAPKRKPSERGGAFLGFGVWDFFGIWDLRFGASLELGV
jgi:hypothetical protein